MEERKKRNKRLTLCDLEIGNRLPFVHRHAPTVANASAAEVDDEFVPIAVEVLEDGF
jgi:hypothetical protein